MGHFAGCRGGPAVAVAPSPDAARPRWLESGAAQGPRPRSPRQGLAGGPAEGRSHACPPGISCSRCCGEPCQGAVPGRPASRWHSEPMAPGSRQP